jgi:hypothetical protein
MSLPFEDEADGSPSHGRCGSGPNTSWNPELRGHPATHKPHCAIRSTTRFWFGRHISRPRTEHSLPQPRSVYQPYARHDTHHSPNGSSPSTGQESPSKRPASRPGAARATARSPAGTWTSAAGTARRRPYRTPGRRTDHQSEILAAGQPVALREVRGRLSRRRPSQRRRSPRHARPRWQRA